MEEIITSRKNSKIREIERLKERKWRRKLQKTVVEGSREIHRVLKCGRTLNSVFQSNSFLEKEENEELAANFAELQIPVYTISSDLMKKIAYRSNPEGIIAVMDTWESSIYDIPIRENSFYLIAEALEKPGNLGAILRSVDASGADALILCNSKIDIFNPNVIRASTGTVFNVPIAELSEDELLNWCTENKVKIITAEPYAENFYFKVDLTGKTAILVGSEHSGVSKFFTENSYKSVKIAMNGKADSLNVSVSAAVLLYEAARQRF